MIDIYAYKWMIVNNNLEQVTILTTTLWNIYISQFVHSHAPHGTVSSLSYYTSARNFMIQS